MLLALILMAQAGVVPVDRAFVCTPTHVWDGDGPVWCREGPRIRLAGIAAREMDGSCKPRHPCPMGDPRRSRDALVNLIGRPVGIGRDGHVLVAGSAMSCVSTGGAGGDRTAAWCVSPKSGDVSCAMVRGGWAIRWDRWWRGRQCP